MVVSMSMFNSTNEMRNICTSWSLIVSQMFSNCSSLSRWFKNCSSIMGSMSFMDKIHLNTCLLNSVMNDTLIYGNTSVGSR